MPKQRLTRRLLIAGNCLKTRVRPIATLMGLVSFVSLVLVLVFPGTTQAVSTSSTINFQARLEQSNGAIAPDGTYNIEFKLYSTASGGTALWTEDYLNANSQGVTVRNGYLSVQLGSITAFPSTINWNQPLYIGLNIGGTGTNALANGTYSGTTDPWNGEMAPRLQLTAVPYAFSSGELTSSPNSSGYQSTLNLTQPASGVTGNEIFQIPDQGASGTYSLCVENSSACGFAPGTSASYIQNTTTQQASSNFNISGTGVAAILQGNTSVLTPTLDTPSAGALSIGTTNATSITVGGSGINTDIAGTLSVGSATAPTNGVAYFNGNVGIGVADPTQALEVSSSALFESGIALGNGTQNGPGMHSDGTNVYIEANNGSIWLRPDGVGVNSNAVTISNTGVFETINSSGTARNILDNGSGAATFQGAVTASSYQTASNGGILDTYTGQVRLYTNTSGVGLWLYAPGGTDINTETAVVDNSTNAFQVQNTSGTDTLNVDTSNQALTVDGTSQSNAQLYVSNGMQNVSTTTTGTNPYSVAVSGSYAYVANGSSDTLESFSISNGVLSSSPVSTVTTGSGPISVAVSGSYAYVVNYNGNTLESFSISSGVLSSSPVSTTTTGTNPYSVAVSGSYAYVVNHGSDTLESFSISNGVLSSSPVSTVTTGSGPISVAVSGSYAYVVNGYSNTLESFSISSGVLSSSPVSTVTTGASPSSVAVSGSYAYVVNGIDTLESFSISNGVLSSSPVSTTATGTGPSSVAVSGSYAYVVNYDSDTLESFSISNGVLSSSPVSTTATGTGPSSVAVSGSYAYVVNYSSDTLESFYIGGTSVEQVNVGNANITGSLNVVSQSNNQQLLNIDASGNTVNIGNYSQGLQISTLPGTLSTSPVSTINTGSSPYSVAVSGSYAYVVNYGSDTLESFSISNGVISSSPLSITNTANSPASVAVSGSYAYVANYGSNILESFSISSGVLSSSPYSSISTQTEPYSVAISGNFAYVTMLTGTLDSFKISNGDILSNAQNVSVGSSPYSVAISGNYAFVANGGSSNLESFAIENSNYGFYSSYPVSTVTTGSTPHSVAISGNYAYVVNVGSNTLESFFIFSNLPVNQGSTTNLQGFTNQIGDASGFVSTIQNTSSATNSGYYAYSADGLLIELGSSKSNWTTGNTFIAFGDTSGNIQGNISAVAGGNGVSYNTTGADYGEYFSFNSGTNLENNPNMVLSSNTVTSLGGSSSNTNGFLDIKPTAGYMVSLTTSGGVALSNNTVPMGIVSNRSGFIGNGPSCNSKDSSCLSNYYQSHVLVSLRGQVPLEVTNKNGDIKVGDPITASDLPGVGELATSSSYIIGYALSSSSSTNGTIQVLVQPGFYTPSMATYLQNSNPVFDSLTINNGVDIGGSLNVSGNSTLANLTVNGKGIFNSNVVINGLTYVQSVSISGHIITSGNAPNIIALEAAGTGATATITGNDTTGTITITTGQKLRVNSFNGTTISGSNPTSGGLVKVVFNKAYGTEPNVILTAVGNSSAGLECNLGSSDNNSFTLNVGLSPQPSTTYTYKYFVVQQ